MKAHLAVISLLGCIALSNSAIIEAVAEDTTPVTSTNPPVVSAHASHLPLPSVEQVITDGVRDNVIGSLSRLAAANTVAGQNITRASALLIRHIVREGFHLGSVATYLPKLLFLDGPNQFIETLRLIRSNQIRAFPNDLNSALDNVMTFTRSVTDSGIPGNFSPLVEFFPNVFTGVETFLRDVMYNVFSWVGPLPLASMQDIKINAQSLRVVSTTPEPNVSI